MKKKGYLLFDIDGVIRDVTASYRLAIQKTVESFSGWKPTFEKIDDLKSEGIWNNDWYVSQELIKRNKSKFSFYVKVPTIDNIRKRFDSYYFGGDPLGESESWEGFIKNERLLVNKDFFKSLNSLNIVWGFVSGTEHASAKFILENKLGLENAPLIAMGDAPDKPNPEGFLNLLDKLSKNNIKDIKVPIGYVGDTVADVLTIKNARSLYPKLEFLSFAISPPHLHFEENYSMRKIYEKNLKINGANVILKNTCDVINFVKKW